MQLKRLELYGFKSFAERTEVEFKPGITAVVGPNGSGKSNLSDAILWVLGEQNVRHLRGDSAADVIFAGTDKRRPVGMAEVCLCMDNSEGRVPLDFTEITVTRRAYRSGESEFFINRAPCRLKDIYELFLDTGIGRDAYSIIGQQQIDRVLSVRGEERRELLEEAAGIKKYRHRRRETVRKLDSTRQNLLRVADILSEIERTLEPLARQSRDALRFQELDARRRDLEVGLLALDYGRHSEELQALAEEMQGLARLLEEHHTGAVALEAEEQRARLTLTEREKAMEELRSSYEAAREEALKLENALALHRQRAASASAQRASLEAELLRLEEKAGELRRQQAELEAERSEAAERLRQAEDRLRSGDPELRAHEAAVRAAREALDSARRQASSLEARRATLSEQLRSARARAAEAEERAETEAGRLHELTEELQTAQEAQARGEAELAAASDTLVSGEAAVQAATERLQASRSEQQAAEERLRRLQGEHLRKAARLRSLEEMHRNLEGAFKGVRAVIQASRAGQLPGRFEVLADLIEAPEALKVALEVALGASAQDIITDTDQEAQAAIRYLKQRNAGRATFLPLDLIRGDRMRPQQAPGVVGVAADLITFPAEVRPAIDSLLGRVLIMEDLPSAIRLVRQGCSASRLVTLEGEVVRPNGALTGGSRDQGPGILSRRIDIQTLSQQVSEEEAELRKEEERATALADAAVQAQRAREEAQSSLHSARVSLERLQASHQALQREVRRLERDRAEAERRQADSHSSTRRHQTSIQTLTVQLEEAEREARALASAIGERETALADAVAAAEAFRGGQSDCRAEAARLRESVSALDRQADGLRAQSRETSELTARHRSALTALEDQVATAAEDERLTACLAAARDRVRLLEEQVREAGALRGQAQEALGALSQRQRESAEAQAALTDRVHRAEVKQAGHEAEVAHIAERLQQEYDLTPDQAAPLADQVTSRHTTVVEVNRLKREIAELGVVNLGAIDEYARLTEREEFLRSQKADLERAEGTLLKVIDEIDEKTLQTFHETYQRVTLAFDAMFQRLFGGGRTQLVLTEPDNLLETGVDIVVQPPGKKLQHLQLLSGGEKALTAVALLFALLEVKPSPFCLLDEVDAALDEANVGRFAQVVKEFSARSQFILVTHNKATMSVADTLCGVTMQEPGVSKLISVRLEDVDGHSGNGKQ